MELFGLYSILQIKAYQTYKHILRPILLGYKKQIQWFIWPPPKMQCMSNPEIL